MATKIKLQVNHGKHSKEESGKKILINPNKPTKNEGEQQKAIQGTQNNKKDPAKPKEPPKQVKSKPQAAIKQDKLESHNSNQFSDIKQISKQVSALSQKQAKWDKQLQTIQRIKKQEQKTKITIQQLINQYKDTAQDMFMNHGHNEEKERMIRDKLQKLKREKSERKQRITKLNQESMSKSLEKEKKSREKQEQQRRREKQKRKMKAQRKIQNLKAMFDKRLQNQIKYQQYYRNQYSHRVPRYKKYEQQFNAKAQQEKQEQQLKLQKHKKTFQPQDYEELMAFAEQYEHERWNLKSQNDRKREFNQEIIDQQNKELESKIWRGQIHKRLRAQLKSKQISQTQAKTRLERTKNYGTIVHDEFRPKINESQRSRSLSISEALKSYNDDDVSTNDGRPYKIIARQKYKNGKNQGLVIENLRKALDHQEQFRKGNQYLQFLRSLPKLKREKQKGQEVNEIKTEQNVKNSPIFIPEKVKNPYYNNSFSQKATSKSIEMDLKKPQNFNKLLASVKQKSQEMQLEQKVIKHSNYKDILDLQEKQSKLNRKMIEGIQQKLSILTKM